MLYVVLNDTVVVFLLSASTDVESISRNLDFNALQDNIMNITFCNIESEVVSHKD